MAQRERFDEPGAWHHVMNRGLARRTIAETRRDARYFLSRLARAVRNGWFEVHAYSLLNTHFHLLLRSPRGEMWRGMQSFQNSYVRYFNRTRKRDGSLLRGRFRSKRVYSNTYWATVIRYIDQNAASARISHEGTTYPFSSAHHYLQASGPPWLSRYEVEDVVRICSNERVYDPTSYLETFGVPLKKSEHRLIDARIDSNDVGQDALDELMVAIPSRVKAWMMRKAHLADGTVSGFPVATPQTIVRRYGVLLKGSPVWILNRESGNVDGWKPLLPGLLRSICGLTYAQIARFSECSVSAVRSRIQLHAKLLKSDMAYAEVAAKLLSNTLNRDWQTYQALNAAGPIK